MSPEIDNNLTDLVDRCLEGNYPKNIEIESLLEDPYFKKQQTFPILIDTKIQKTNDMTKYLGNKLNKLKSDDFKSYL